MKREHPPTLNHDYNKHFGWASCSTRKLMSKFCVSEQVTEWSSSPPPSRFCSRRFLYRPPKITARRYIRFRNTINHGHHHVFVHRPKYSDRRQSYTAVRKTAHMAGRAIKQALPRPLSSRRRPCRTAAWPWAHQELPSMRIFPLERQI